MMMEIIIIMKGRILQVLMVKVKKVVVEVHKVVVGGIDERECVCNYFERAREVDKKY